MATAFTTTDFPFLWTATAEDIPAKVARAPAKLGARLVPRAPVVRPAW